MGFVKVLVFLSFVISGNCADYIFRLNGSDYARMPALFHLDRYEECLHEEDGSGVYCSVKFDLVTDRPNKLHKIITEYSAKSETHFNHTQLWYGICLTKTCKKFYTQNTTRDLRSSLEACLNDSIWTKYSLKTKVWENYTCEKQNEETQVDTSDIVVAIVLVTIFMLHIIGSFQEFYLEKQKNNKGNRFLACFSISRNWKKMTAPAGEGPEPRLSRLTGVHGVKAISSMLVIMIHSMLSFVINCDNPQDFEEGYNKPYYQIMANGSLAIQTFFLMSSFLLAYNMQIYAENHKITWSSAPQAIIVRWLRLTPPNLVILAITATWMRHFGSGPLWQTAVVSEVEDCRRDWWYHVFYLNNYLDNSHCLIQNWYVAADFQLFCVGVLVLVLTRGRGRKILLGILCTAGIIVPAIYTYLLDLNGYLMMTPEVTRNQFIKDPTFTHTYTRAHTNILPYATGLSMGLLVYSWQITAYKHHPYLKHRFTYWLSVPLGVALIYLASVFYRDAPRDPVFVRTLYAALIRPAWNLLAAYFITGLVFQFEDVYRGILEWPGWTVPSRVSYCVYLIHMTLVRLLTGTRTTTSHFSLLHLLEVLTSSFTITFLAAVPFHLLFETPFLQMVKLGLSAVSQGDNGIKEVELPQEILTKEDVKNMNDDNNFDDLNKNDQKSNGVNNK